MGTCLAYVVFVIWCLVQYEKVNPVYITSDD